MSAHQRRRTNNPFSTDQGGGEGVFDDRKLSSVGALNPRDPIDRDFLALLPQNFIFYRTERP
jgi:hypothetical protein